MKTGNLSDKEDLRVNLGANHRRLAGVFRDRGNIMNVLVTEASPTAFADRRTRAEKERPAVRRLVTSIAGRVLAAALIVLSLSSGPALADRFLEGRVTVVRDVDTIVVSGVPVRLNGVDGPETSNRLGRDARTFMERLVRGRTVSCRLNGDRTYDRWVGICYLDGQDIGAIAVANGHALDCRRYSGGRYRSLETSAARSRLTRAGYCR